MTSMPNVRPVTDEVGLGEVYDALLALSFPPSELMARSWLVDGVAAGRLSVLAGRDDTGPVATAITQSLAPAPAVLLTYFATRGDMRGRGVGSALFGHLREAVLERERPSIFLAEVERPDRHPGSAEHGDPAARLRFYGRHGARALDLPYLQAPIGEGDAVRGMLLLALHVEPGVVLDGSEGGSAVPGPALLAEAVDVLLDGFGQDAPDPRADRLRAAAASPAVSLYDVADYSRIPSS